MARWTAGEHAPLPNGILLTQEVRDGVCRVSLHLDPDREGPLFSGEPKITALRGVPGQPPQTETVAMRWKTANLLEAELPLGGAETLVASVGIEGFSPVAMPPACLKYSPEYAPREPGSGRPALERLATVGGGRERIDVGSIWDDLPSPWRWLPLRPALLLLAVLLFVLEIVERRVGLRQLGQTRRSAPPEKRRGASLPAALQKHPVKKPAAKKPEPEAATGSTASALKSARARARARFRR